MIEMFIGSVIGGCIGGLICFRGGVKEGQKQALKGDDEYTF